MTLAATTDDIFGTIKPPVSTIPEEPLTAAGSLFSLVIQLFIIFASLALLVYLLWGAFEWITSGGEKEKISKAQLKITNAIVGIIVVIVVLVIFNLITVDILHIFDAPFTFKLPTI